MPKKPKIDKNIQGLGKKVPRTELQPDDKGNVQWCFKLFDSHKWPLKLNGKKQYQPDCFYDIAKHLQSYQGLTWADIKHRDHPVPKNRIIKQAQSRLKELKQDDVDDSWRIRLNGRQRLWGIRHLNYFRVLWWDPLHQVCPSNKRHT